MILEIGPVMSCTFMLVLMLVRKGKNEENEKCQMKRKEKGVEKRREGEKSGWPVGAREMESVWAAFNWLISGVYLHM